MDASDVIDSYVHDVARQLPHGKRNDVAFELRALLADELRARAEGAGRDPDRDMAVDMLRAHGWPSQTAARYSQPFTIIEPSDTWRFLVATIAGGAVITLVSPGMEGGQATSTFLGWLGALVVAFGLKNLIMRHRPESFRWKPRPVRDPDRASRVRNAVIAVAALALMVLYWMPGGVAEALSGGRVAAETLAYSDSFQSPLRMPWLAGILALTAALHVAVALQGRWRPVMRWVHIALVFNIAYQLGWHVQYGSVFEDPRIDTLLGPTITLVSALVMVVCGIELYRELTRVRPAPSMSGDAVHA